MIVIIPLGGTGQRFKENGYLRPKALIRIFGKPILYYLLDTLNVKNIDTIYIPYNPEYTQYRLEDDLKKNYPTYNFRFHNLKANTRGAAETIKIALDHFNDINPETPVLCLDSDNFYLEDLVSKWNQTNCIFTFTDTDSKPIYSYVRCTKQNTVEEICEKQKISNQACTGGYGFKSISLLHEYTKKIINNNIMQKQEFYTSGVIQYMILEGHNFETLNVPKTNFVCLGTPIQIKMFYNNYPKISSINNKTLIVSKRICFDLDNTLVTYPTVSNDYSTVKPIENNIRLLRYLKSFNNTIIIYTARRMKTYGGDVGKIMANIGQITFDTLEKFNIPYDEIYFGKPYADFYIDDLAVNCFDSIEKEIGFYNTIIEPRDFNTIEDSYVESISKSGTNLSGEIYFYTHIPIPIKDLFPVFFGHNGDSYTIEKIQGLTVSDLYISELLSPTSLKHVLNSIRRIQSIPIQDANDNTLIYSNYAKKLTKRFIDYDYSQFEDYDVVYDKLLTCLTEYENQNLGKKTIIHGDPVFTNIFINNYDKIKFIDMRGCQGDICSIYGDWLYDWAKLYQSLIGYDEILLLKSVSLEYKEKMINVFKEYFLQHYSKLDWYYLNQITQSLIFTLIPLHNNDKCKHFYELMNSPYLQTMGNNGN
jgi:capsule biosynthesis phosphatase